MLLSPELSTLPFLLDHSRQHTQIPLHFPTPRLPMLPSCFLYSRPPLLHLLIPPQRVFCSFPFTLAVVSKVTKACFPVVHRHGYLLTFSYSVPRHQSKLWSQLSISFFWGCLFSFYACGSTLSWLSPPSKAPCKQFYKLLFRCYTSKVQSVLGLGLSYLKSYFELGFLNIAIKNTGCLLKFEFYVTFFSVSMFHVVWLHIHLSISIYLLYKLLGHTFVCFFFYFFFFTFVCFMQCLRHTFY